jgi:outer membrane protein TolC
MNLRRPFIWLFTTFLVIHQAYSQQQFSLSQCLDYTLINSPKLKAEKLSQEKETAELLEQKSAYLPHIDAFVNYHNYFSDLPTYIFPTAEGSVLAGEQLTAPYALQLGLPHNLNTGMQFSQTLFDMNFFGNGLLREKYQAYNNTRLTIAEEEALYQVAVLFYQVALNEARLDFLDMNLQRLHKLQDLVKLQVSQGFAKQIDFDKLVVKTSNLQSGKNKLQSGIAQQIRYLKLMMGMSQEEQLSILYEESEKLNGDVYAMEKGEISEEKLLKDQQELNKMNAKRLNAAYYPRLQAYAAFLFQAQRQQLNFLASNQDWYNIHQWGLKLSVPIMHGLERKNKKEISEIADAQLTFGLEQRQAQSEVEFQNAVAELEVARGELYAQEANVKLAEQVYKQSELSYEQGTMLLMDFLDSEATLRESKMIYASAILDTRMAELKILKVSGNIRELVNH